MDCHTMYDMMVESQLTERIISWIESRDTPSTSCNEIDLAFNSVTPRSVFLKNIARGASLLDLGAGDGSLSVYRNWPLFRRPDIKMYAFSLSKGERFGDYDAYELENFEKTNEVFRGIALQAFVCCHFIEHMADPRRTLDFFGQRLQPGGRIYLEWPHQISKRMPSRTLMIDKGIDIMTTRFDDDPTHVEAWDMSEIVFLLRERGFVIETKGRAHFPFLAEELRNHGRAMSDPVRNTLAVWALVGWAQYVIAAKPY